MSCHLGNKMDSVNSQVSKKKKCVKAIYKDNKIIDCLISDAHQANNFLNINFKHLL